MATTPAATAARGPGQLFALVFGAVYLVVGIIGFFLDPEIFGIFGVNALHNIVHLALGVTWLAVFNNAATTKSVNLIFGVVLIAVAILGFAGLLDQDGIVNLNIEAGAGGADNWLHIATGVLALYFGTAGATTTRAPAATA